MKPSSLFRLSVVATIAALAGMGAQAREAYQYDGEPPVAANGRTPDSVPAGTTIVLATPRHFGEATQWVDTASAPVERGAVLAQTRQARQRGLLNDTGEAGASERVLVQREAFNQQEHDRIVAEFAAAQEAQRVAIAEQQRLSEMASDNSSSDPLIALLLIDETDPTVTAVYAYTPNDVSQWRATPVDRPQPTLPDDKPSAPLAPAPSTELRFDDDASARAGR